jgi:transcriptional regulator with XRE-family HTH domain
VHKGAKIAALDPHRDRWYYLTMSYRVPWHPLDDPTIYRIGYIRGVCSHLLKETRQKVGLSQRALASQSGVSLSTVAKAEQGRQNLSMDTMAKLVDAMGFRMGLIAYTPGSSVFDTAAKVLGIGPRETDEDVGPHVEEDHEDNHEEDGAPIPDPADDPTEEELEQEIIREITRIR